MKKTLMLLTVFTLVSCGSWNRIGDLTSISNRNIDDSKKFIELNRDVEVIIKTDKDALEQAVDDLTKKYQGEFVRNVKIYVKDNGKKVKLVGDVWGVQNTNVQVTTEAKTTNTLNVGDQVVFKKKGKLSDGRIVGLNPNSVIVECSKGKKSEVKYDDVTKTK